MNTFFSPALRVGSRSSSLALLQVDEVIGLLAKAGVCPKFEARRYQSGGDRDKTTPLTAGVPDDFFTDVLDRAVLSSEIDVAIHSAKDLPRALHSGLKIFALTASVDETDAFVGAVPFDRLKPGARIGTSSDIRQKSILELRPDVIPFDIRGTIQERLKMVDEGICDGVIVATAALKRLKLADRISSVMPWAATPLQGQLAVVGRVGDIRNQELFAAIDVRRHYGRVILAGAGPGDPDLVTLKTVKALNEADCVVYDYLVDARLLQHAPKAEPVFAGKRKGCHSLAQSELNQILKTRAMAGQKVVRLKGGDPFIFGRGAEELDFLMAYHIPVDIIPGVSSATGLPGSLGVPLTARGLSSSVALISGHSDEKSVVTQLDHLPEAETIVFLMGLTKLDQIVEALRRKQWSEDTPVMVISKGTTAEERVITATVGTIQKEAAARELPAPALIVAGRTLKYLEAFRDRNGRTLLTGLHPRVYAVFEPLVHVPTVEIVPAAMDRATSDRFLRSLDHYDAMIITSGCGVKHFKEWIDREKVSLQTLLSKTTILIGQETARAFEKHFNRPADIVAEIETSEGLLDVLFRNMDVKDKRFLFPRSQLSNPTIKTEIERHGGHVEEMIVYENRKAPKQSFSAGLIRQVIFTSPSTVRNYLEDYGPIPKEWVILARGPLTQRELATLGYESFVIET